MNTHRKSRRLEEKKKRKEIVVVNERPRPIKTLKFIKKAIVVDRPDGTQVSVWDGVKKEWESDSKEWGVITTQHLPKDFAIPYGAAPYEITDKEFAKLKKRGGRHLYYTAEYNPEAAKGYRGRKQALKSRKSSFIIDANPIRAEKLGYPEDCWIGSIVNSVKEGDTSNNCYFEIVGEEYKDERNYDYCKYFLFVVLKHDLPAGTWMSVPYNWGKHFASKHLGKPSKVLSGKRKVGKLITNTLPTSLPTSSMSITSSADSDEEKPVVKRRRSSRKDYLLVDDDDTYVEDTIDSSAHHQVCLFMI